MRITWDHVSGTKKGFNLEDISFSLEQGYILGIVGANGAGKTTMLKYMLQEKKCYTGGIRLDGKEIHEDHSAFLQEIGYISDDRDFFFDHSAKVNVELLSPFYPRFDYAIFHAAMKQMGLKEGKVVGKMSRGEYMKFQMAFTMAYRPKLYLIDEATGGMDIVFVKEFYETLQKQVADTLCSVIMVSHSKKELERLMDYVLVIENGRQVSFEEGGSC